MQKWLRDIALCYSSGSVGAVAQGGLIWLCEHFLAAGGFAAHLASAQYPKGIYARSVWGGIAAFLFLLPLVRGNWCLRGLFWGAVVAAIQLVVIPLLGHGSVHFALVPMLSVLVLSCFWGIAAALALRLFGG